MKRLEIAFFQLDPDQDVTGPHEPQTQVGDTHDRRAPKGAQKAGVQRMPDHLVRSRRVELQGGVGSIAEMQPDLAQAKEIEMVDEKSRREHQQPAKSAAGMEQQSNGR